MTNQFKNGEDKRERGDAEGADQNDEELTAPEEEQLEDWLPDAEPTEGPAPAP
ncbi:hypothetical protein [Okibacterium endophyticum]